MNLKSSMRSPLLAVLIAQQILLPLGAGAGFGFGIHEARADGRIDDNYDVDKYAEIARRTEQEAREKKDSLDRAESAERDARQARDAAQGRLAKTRQDLQEAQADAQAARTDIPQLRDRIAQLAQQIRGLETAVTQAQADLEQARAESQRKDARAKDLEAKAKAAKDSGAPNAEELARQAREARAAASAAAQDAREAAQRLETAQRNLTQAKSESADAQARLQRRQAELERLTQQTIPSLQQQESAQSAALQQAEQVLAARDRDADQARTAYQAARDRADAAARRYGEVRANLDRAVAEARELGERDGAREGSEDGSTAGRNDGIREGSQAGVNEGRRDGMAEGMQRARQNGTRDGQSAGWQLGSSTGARDGATNGRREGAEKGRDDGLIAGYRAGYAEGDTNGFAKGTDQGHQDGGYEKGRAQGRVDGEARAVAEANQTGVPQGYAEAEAQLRAGPLDDSSIAGPAFRENSEWKFFNSQSTASGQDGLTAPAFGLQNGKAMKIIAFAGASRPTFPHPAAAEAYQRAFDATYRQVRQQSYDREYRESYRVAYDANYRHEYSEWATKDYPNEYREAYDRASAIAYNDAYQREYQANYDRAYRPSYDSAYADALPVRRKEGYDRGYAEGFKRGRKEAFDQDYGRGYDEAETASHDAAYPAALERAREQGRQSARAFYASHAVLEVQDLRLTDRSGDGIFAAGEPIDLRAVVSNFGQVAATGAAGLAVEFAPLSEGIELSTTTAAAPALSARTRTTVQSLGSSVALRLKASVALGVSQRVRVRLTQAGTVLSERVLEIRPAQALQVIDVRFSGPVSDSIWNDAVLTIRNQGTRPTTKAVHVRLKSSESGLEIDNAEFDVPALTAGETRELQVRFRFAQELAFRKIPLEVSLVAGTYQAGASRIEFDTTRRWSHNPSSEGLLVVTSREEGLALEQATRAAGRAFDIWDTQAEGALHAEPVRLYRNRLVVVADARTVTDAETRDSLLAAFEAGTSALDLSVAKSSSSGRRGSLADAVEDRASSVPLDQVVDTVLVRESNPFSGAAAIRWMTRVTDTDGGTAGLARAIVQSTAVNRPFDEQLATAQRDDHGAETAAALRAVSHSLIMEMRGVNAVDGNQFSSKSTGFDQLKLNRYVGTLLGTEPSKVHGGLLTLFPELDSARKDLGGWFDRQRLQAKKILKPVAKLYRNG